MRTGGRGDHKKEGAEDHKKGAEDHKKGAEDHKKGAEDHKKGASQTRDGWFPDQGTGQSGRGRHRACTALKSQPTALCLLGRVGGRFLTMRRAQGYIQRIARLVYKGASLILLY